MPREGTSAGPKGTGTDEGTLRALGMLPTSRDWPDLPEEELDRRRRELWQASLRLLEDGPRHAVPASERGRQFAPFAALRGYDHMVAEVERQARGRGDA